MKGGRRVQMWIGMKMQPTQLWATQLCGSTFLSQLVEVRGQMSVKRRRVQLSNSLDLLAGVVPGVWTEVGEASISRPQRLPN